MAQKFRIAKLKTSTIKVQSLEMVEKTYAGYKMH
jgi:hypothetical protein